MRIDIVACADKGFVMPTGVMMYSACVNNPDVDIVFHIIHDWSVSSRDKHDLADVVNKFNKKSIIFYPVTKQILNGKFPALETKSHITQATYYRLFLTDLLPLTLNKVLYLDGDIIVRHSLLPLWNYDIDNYALAGACDMSESVLDYNLLNYPSSLGYFNAGVLLINLKYWRDHAVTIDFIEYIQNHSANIRQHDQDVLNIVFRFKKSRFPIKYNLQQGFLTNKTGYDYNKYKNEVLEARRDPIIVHYTGKKPWSAYDREQRHPFASSFFRYQNQTKWKGQRIDKRPFKLRIINFVADTLRKYGLKSQLPTSYEYLNIPPID